jgi:hypothetical protein
VSIYKVEVTEEKKAFIYVEADSAGEAREAAEELMYDLVPSDWDYDTDSYVWGEVPVEKVEDRYWSGGEDGDWVSAN